MNWKCLINLHEWTRWEDTTTVSVFANDGDSKPSGRFLTQTRVCTACNKKDSRRVRI
jgi:hypothetical protein